MNFNLFQLSFKNLQMLEYLPVRILIVICRDRNSMEASLWRENTSRLILIRGNFILTKLVFFFVSLFVIVE